MKKYNSKWCFKMICLMLFAMLSFAAAAQQSIMVNLAAIDGIAITPDNIFNYQVQSSRSGNAEVKGTIRYRNSNLSLSYIFTYPLRQGLNILSADMVHPRWQFSSSALQELFLTYKVLPSGTFEYCVTVTPVNGLKENNGRAFDECLYHRSDEFFLINLVEPNNKEKLKEYNPLLTWIANYSFSNELTYRVRVAEIKQGQNAVNAIMRNQPFYDEKNLMQNSIVYPVYAKPLISNQWYAWTVDAYYKGILLGGAETWQFIIPDSIPPVVKNSRSYIDIKRESGLSKLAVVGSIKLKYVLEDVEKDSLYLQILDEGNKSYIVKPSKLSATYGDNRYELDLMDVGNLKHLSMYRMKITTKTRHEYNLLFQYINPEYQH